MDVITRLKNQQFSSLAEVAYLLEENGFKNYGSIKYSYNKRTTKEKLYLATGGWSENEYMISAFQENIFWTAYWIKSERGGAFYFERNAAPSAVNGE